jgi:hypothetical protein
MGEAIFRLAEYTNSKGKSPIMLDYNWTVVSGQNLRIGYSTKCSIFRAHWNPKTQRPRNIMGCEKEYKMIAAHLDKIEEDVKLIYRKYQLERRLIELDRDRMRYELDEVLKANRPVKSTTNFFHWCEDYYTNIYPKEATYNLGTAKVLKTTLNHLTDFAKEINTKIDFYHFNKHFYSQFVSFLRTKKNLSDNTIEKIVFAGLKRYLNEATEAKVNTFTAYKDVTPRKVMVKKTKGDKIYLDQGELKRMYEHNGLPQHLERVRDAFVCATLLGLRYGDWEKVHQKNLVNIGDGRKALSIILEKEPQPRIVVPCHPVVMAILEKYNGALPVLSNQKMNAHLKEVGQEVGMDSLERKTIRKGKVIESQHQKFELLTCHVARNCFESNARRAQIPQRDIDLFTGHTSKNVSDIYDRRQLETIASDYKFHPFFNEW